MRRLSATLLLTVVGCTPTAPPPGDAPPTKQTAPTPEEKIKNIKPAAPQEPMIPAVGLINWQLHLTTQFFGTALGPLKEIKIDSTGKINIAIDGKVTAESTLQPAQIDLLSRLLAAPELAAARPSDSPDVGPVGRLVVTGDVSLDINLPTPGVDRVIDEVGRLRDLVGPPENFKISATAAERSVLVSSNGYVEVWRDGTRVTNHFLPAPDSLQPLLALLSARAIRDPGSWTAPDSPARLKISGDLQAEGPVDMTIKSAGSALHAEVMRLGDVVEAKLRPPSAYELVYTRRTTGAGGPGSPRTITVRAGARKLALVDAGPGAARRERELTPEELSYLSTKLIDPSLRTAPAHGPSGEGASYTIKVTGDAPMDVTWHGDPPPPVTDLINHLDHLASRLETP